jgi:hypothetical protein
MTIPTLPTGARLALINWPWGTPTDAHIVAAIDRKPDGTLWTYRETIYPLLAAGLIADLQIISGINWRYRLTQAGRKALDVLQSGVE